MHQLMLKKGPKRICRKYLMMLLSHGKLLKKRKAEFLSRKNIGVKLKRLVNIFLWVIYVIYFIKIFFLSCIARRPGYYKNICKNTHAAVKNDLVPVMACLCFVFVFIFDDYNLFDSLIDFCPKCKKFSLLSTFFTCLLVLVMELWSFSLVYCFMQYIFPFFIICFYWNFYRLLNGGHFIKFFCLTWK